MCWQTIEFDEIQCGLMPGRGILGAIFILRQLKEKHLAANKPLMAFVNLESIRSCSTGYHLVGNVQTRN